MKTVFHKLIRLSIMFTLPLALLTASMGAASVEKPVPPTLEFASDVLPAWAQPPPPTERTTMVPLLVPGSPAAAAGVRPAPEPTAKGEIVSSPAPEPASVATPAIALDVLLAEGFEAGLIPPAGGWTVTNTHPTRNWTSVDAVTYPDFVHSGSYAAWVNYDTPIASDEWLLTPPIDLTGIPDASLNFWAIGDTNYCPGAGSGANMLLHVTNTGGTPIATVWDMCADETWSSFVYRLVTVDLSAYEDQTIKLAWQYIGIDGDSFGLDDISLTGTLGDAGWLGGHVMDAETGGIDPTCTGAVVHIEPGDTDIQADPATGYYGPVHLISGTYSLEASAPGFSVGTSVVTITTDVTSTQDFGLWRPMIAVTPTDFISTTVYINQETTYSLTIYDGGHRPLDFEIHEIPTIIPLNVLSAPQSNPDIKVEPRLLAQLDADEVAGYTIHFRERPDLSPAFQMDWHERGWFVMKTLQTVAERSQANVRSYLDRQGADYQAFWIDNVIVVNSAGRDTLNGLMNFPEIAALRAHRTMHVIEPSQKNSQGDSVPMAIESNISHVGADQVWGMGFQGEGLVVANIDTGVRYTHYALVNQYRGNQGGGSYDHDYNWLDADTGRTTPFDDHGHGSHTMGTMIGDDGGTNQIGMAPDARWIACDACNASTGCPGAALLTCAQWIAAPYPVGNPSSPDPDMRPHVVNNSWGDCERSYDNWYQNAVDVWHAAGIYPVFSNGNNTNCGYPAPPGCNTVGNPARYGNVTGVGSTDQSNGQYATHSNWGPTDDPDTVNPRGYPNLKPQVVAPGVNIRSSLNGSDSHYASWGGTSMSAPHVAAMVALMWQAAPCLVGDYATTETIIEQTATPITYTSSCSGEGPGNVPNHATGWGEINAFAAVQTALNQCDLPWVWGDPITGTVPGPGTIKIDVTFHCTETQDYTGTLRILHNDPCLDSVDVPIVIHCQEHLSEPDWNKRVSVNGVLTDTSPISIVPSDTVQIVDRVWITYTDNVTFTLVETWTESLDLTGWISDSGSITTNAHSLTWGMRDAAPNTWYAITKTFNVISATWVYDYITETLWVENAAPQLPDRVFWFAHPHPDISVTPLSLKATLSPDDTVTRTLSISNGGTADLTWSLAESLAANWLSEAPTSGTTAAPNSAGVVVTFDTTGLSDDIYSTTLQITSNAPDEPQVNVPVTLTVQTLYYAYLPIVLRGAGTSPAPTYRVVFSIRPTSWLPRMASPSVDM
ncbi:MAG: S8 family serine peptidase [Chloroflexota bacterium]|nr:S8 family serine peptidase [Chloroflexota bacterium]